ncbi:hypothetical protein [Streptomyces inhibens]|uniref:hypothetical protein n=1 Tax=Streptomyces inhibens TaxID=2293571 RepID=UPI001EE755C6|nr:hypothetical protein [Streptomyces inhibens]UKY52117.1 hypothetical protein KI385_27095 [Streptomyces inhibens]
MRITLPQLGVGPVSCASGSIAPLVELGRCNPDTAQRLANVLADFAKAAVPGHSPEGQRP